MKKVISIFIAATFILSSVVVAFAAPLSDRQESSEMNGFIDGITQLVRKYDADKEFVVSEPEKADTAQTFSATQNDFAASATAQNTEENAGDSTEPAYTLQDFQTARLIVRASGNFDDFGALENVSGFEDFHILQYETPEAAMEACEKLQTQNAVYSAAPDEVVAPLQGEQSENTEKNADKYLCEWSHDRTQSDRLLDYIESADVQLEKTVVAVVDDGVHYDHPFLEGRIERTNFNSSSSGNANDEYGSPEDSHGTGVCSVIADNTPDDVLIRCYKVLDDGGYAPISQMCVGYMQAVEDGADVINISLGYWDETGLTQACVKAAYEKNIAVFAAMGNSGEFDQNTVPGNIPECISVSATDSENTTVLWGTWSDASDISAPGQGIDVAMLENEYAVWDGTSFASPCAAALGAILKAQNPNITVDEMEEKIKSTSFDVKRYDFAGFNENNFTDSYHTALDGVGMIQYADAFGLPELAAPVFNLEDNAIYLGAQTCSLTCADDSAVILYTTDGTYPDLESANVYTKPFEVAERTRIRAAAYYPDGGYYSRENEITPRIMYQDSEDMYSVTADGVITAYSGKVADLFVPQTIHGVTVTGIERNAFEKAAITGIVLPETVTEIPDNAFYRNASLEFIRGDGVTSIGTQVFYESGLKYAEFPNVTEIGLVSFKMTSSFISGYFPKLEVVGARAFQYSAIVSFDAPEVRAINRGAFASCTRLESVNIPNCTQTVWGIGGNGEFESDGFLSAVAMPSIQNLMAGALRGTRIVTADFPLVKTMGTNAFYDCMSLKVINMPSLESVPKGAFNGYGLTISNPKGRVYYLDNVTEIDEDAFGFYPTARIEFSHLVTAKSLPASYNENSYFAQQCTIAMPSTFRECTEDTTGRNYKVYGTKGTYAETWANDNGHEFIEISQETALLQDVPMEYTDETQVLSPDVIGFNRTYQWYGSFTADNTSGEPIEGATEKAFNPADYPAYPYYYCVVTSTDIGFDPVEIRTGVTANKVALADYTAYDQAVAEANALDRGLYQDLTALDAALAVDVSGKKITEQAIVDAQTAAIIAALESLQYKPADYSNVESAKAKIPVDLSAYTDDSRKELQAALDAVDYSLNITEQAQADAYAEAIIIALDGLKRKPTEPVTPEKPINPESTTNAKPSADSSADTSHPQAPDIPKTGVNDAQVVGAAFIIFLSLLALYSKRQERKNF